MASTVVFHRTIPIVGLDSNKGCKVLSNRTLDEIKHRLRNRCMSSTIVSTVILLTFVVHHLIDIRTLLYVVGQQKKHQYIDMLVF